jgi:hypothetical protein
MSLECAFSRSQAPAGQGRPLTIEEVNGVALHPSWTEPPTEGWRTEQLWRGGSRSGPGGLIRGPGSRGGGHRERWTSRTEEVRDAVASWWCGWQAERPSWKRSSGTGGAAQGGAQWCDAGCDDGMFLSGVPWRRECGCYILDCYACCGAHAPGLIQRGSPSHTRYHSSLGTDTRLRN